MRLPWMSQHQAGKTICELFNDEQGEAYDRTATVPSADHIDPSVAL